MKYIKDQSKLGMIIDALSSKEVHITKFFRSHLKHQLATVFSAEDKLVILFAIANSERQGKGKDNKSLVAATASFYQGLAQEIKKSKSLGAEQAHKEFLEWLCDIPGMGQKTANLFMKWVVMFENDFKLSLINWQSWKSHLDVPLDRWVIRLMSSKGSLINNCNNFLAFCVWV